MTDLIITGLSGEKGMGGIEEAITPLVRALDLTADEGMSFDGWHGTLSLAVKGDRMGNPITAGRQTTMGKKVASVDAKALARALAAMALEITCRRELRRLALDRLDLAPAWATTVSFDIALAAKLEDRTPQELYDALKAVWTAVPASHHHLQGKWHAGRRNAMYIERRGFDAGLPNWPGMSGIARPSHYGSHIELEMLDLDGGAYLSARNTNWRLSIPREMSDEEVAKLGDGVGIRRYVDSAYVRGRRLLVNSVSRSKKKTTLALQLTRTHKVAEYGYTTVWTKVRVADVPKVLRNQAERLAKAILKAGCIEDETIELVPFGIDGGRMDVIDFADVRPDPMPDIDTDLPVVGQSALAARIKTSFLKRMGQGETDPWEGVARDVAEMMRDAGVFLGPDLMELTGPK